MQALEEILNLPSVNKNEVVKDLLQEVAILREQLELSVNARIRLGDELRQEMYTACNDYDKRISVMDDIAAENTIMVKCVKCDCMYELPCDLSEFDPEYSYCGKGGPSPCTP